MCTAFFMYAFGTIEKERAFNERVIRKAKYPLNTHDLKNAS
jgi:hypothetical protein